MNAGRPRRGRSFLGGARVSDSNTTKLALANSLKALMAKKSFERISVGDISKDCRLTRQTFYYHFQDKYDLMNWIYYTETVRCMSGDDAPGHWTERLTRLCRYMRENKTFYRNALATTGANAFPEYLFGYIRSMAQAAVEGMTGEEYDPARWDFFTQFFATAFVSYIVRWAGAGMKEDPAAFIEKIRELYDGSAFAELERIKTE